MKVDALNTIQALTEALLDYAEAQGWSEVSDRIYLRNRLVAFLEIPPYQVANASQAPFSVAEDQEIPRTGHGLLEAIVNWAAQNGRIDSAHPDTADYFDTELMDLLLPRPSQIDAQFIKAYQQSPKAAADWFYSLSQATQYIRTERVAKNVIWEQPTPYGDMVFTINLSKPEKDPKAIAAQARVASTAYPQCLLCYENVGYSGHAGHPARQSHRVIPLTLGGEPWFYQYSPYVYYNEHAIVVSKAHVPMAITEKTFERLLDFVDFMPHYFVGSNADLPIVGGSMLSHDHYQGGNFEMPMAKAKALRAAKVPGLEGVDMDWLHWPLTTLRLRSKDRAAIQSAAGHVLRVWRSYDDMELGLRAVEHTITPIARFKAGAYELDLVLRSCQVSKDHPDGVYHPHVEIHHVKKENIGLIEVMGLAVLPPRLETVAAGMAMALTKGTQPEQVAELPEAFLDMYQALWANYSGSDPATTQRAVYTAIGEVFVKGLEHCGVMPLSPEGDAARARFEAALSKRL